MTTLAGIQQQIEKLKKQADEIRAKELNKTMQEIIEKMHAFGISIKDIQKAMSAPKASAKGKVGRPAAKQKSKRVSALAGKPVAPKYRGPNGETWTGRGLMPKWLADLVAQGRSKEEFAIRDQGPDQSVVQAQSDDQAQGQLAQAEAQA